MRRGRRSTAESPNQCRPLASCVRAPCVSRLRPLSLRHDPPALLQVVAGALHSALPPGKVQLRIELPGNAIPIVVEAEVCWENSAQAHKVRSLGAELREGGGALLRYGM